ncbi:MAG TPA: hypothetical protein VN924_33540 [Bryobacteraceae bacterium]|nr:hypothetical protein [Bryobacteraceae bacterium]
MIQVRRFHDNELDDSRLADELCIAAHHVASLQSSWTAEVVSFQPEFLDCVLALEDKDEAVAIHKQMHYIGSPRPDGIHLSLRAPVSQGGHLLCLATLSQMDLPHLGPLLPSSTNLLDEFLVLSRFFVVDGGGPNLASHFLGRVFAWVRSNLPDIAGLLTYLNPNVGFTGALYRATNWVMIGLEHKRRYLYLDDEYVTDRRMIEDFGTADHAILARRVGARITRSRSTLAPLKVYAYPLRRRLRRQLSQLEGRRGVQPPISRVGL